MDIEGIGAGVGSGGVIGAVLTWLGFKSRIDNIEKRFEDHQNRVVHNDTCNQIHKGVDQRFEGIDEKLNQILNILIKGK